MGEAMKSGQNQDVFKDLKKKKAENLLLDWMWGEGWEEGKRRI